AEARSYPSMSSTGIAKAYAPWFVSTKSSNLGNFNCPAEVCSAILSQAIEKGCLAVNCPVVESTTVGGPSSLRFVLQVATFGSYCTDLSVTFCSEGLNPIRTTTWRVSVARWEILTPLLARAIHWL